MYKGRNIFFIVGLITIVIFALGIALRAHAPGPTTGVISFNGVSLSVVIADDDMERQQGLSGKSSLGEYEGMFFIFDAPGMYPFWMKDMNFPIDIVWMDENWQVVDITENISPDTYPQAFASRIPVKYVLEIPAGSVERFTIEKGIIVHLRK